MNAGKLVGALRELLRAEQEEREARERYEGFNWGYHGYQWLEAKHEAEEAFASALEEVIDARVIAVLEERRY